MQNYLVFQPVYNFLKTFANGNKVTSWKSKGLSDEGIKPPSMSGNSLNPGRIAYIDNAKIRVKFDGSCLKQENVTFTHKQSVIIYIVSKIDLSIKKDFPLKNSVFGAVKLTRNVNSDKYSCSGYGIGYDVRRSFSLSDGSGFGKNKLIFVADMNSSEHIDNKKKYILILGKSPVDDLDDTTLTTEKEYSRNFTGQQNKFSLSLHYNGLDNYIFFSGVEIYKFKGKNSEINAAPLSLGDVQKIWII